MNPINLSEGYSNFSLIAGARMLISACWHPAHAGESNIQPKIYHVIDANINDPLISDRVLSI